MRHGLAAIRCLLASQPIFASEYLEGDRALRVLRGVYGFQMYATEFWIDYILEHFALDEDLLFKSEFFFLSCRLAEHFELIDPNEVAAEICPPNSRLIRLRQKHYSLYNAIQTGLLEKSREMLEDNGMFASLSWILQIICLIIHELRRYHRQHHQGQRHSSLERKLSDDNSRVA